jgi:hypothetical protein
MIVRIYVTEHDGSREAGRLRLDGAAICIESAMPGDRRLLENVLSEPILIDDEGRPAIIRAATDPTRFLENLCWTYFGSYLRVSKPEQGSAHGR